MLPLVRRTAALALKVAAALAFLAPLATRVVLGRSFYQTGLGKWTHFDNTVVFFTELGILLPEANAAVVATLELVGGCALVVGLLTRPFAAALATTMGVALLTADKERFLGSWSGDGDIGLLDIPAFVYLLFCAWLALYGPGALSLDALLKRRLGIGTPPTPSGPATPAAPQGTAAGPDAL
jgi:putative oxidoreductase